MHTRASSTCSWRWSAAPATSGARVLGAGADHAWSKQWLQDCCCRSCSAPAGNFEVIVFGIADGRACCSARATACGRAIAAGCRCRARRAALARRAAAGARARCRRRGERAARGARRDASASAGWWRSTTSSFADRAPARSSALIGPNGAGKSTMFNLISGVLAPTRRRGALSRRAGGGPPRARDRRGAASARTFQHVKLLPADDACSRTSPSARYLREQPGRRAARGAAPRPRRGAPPAAPRPRARSSACGLGDHDARAGRQPAAGPAAACVEIARALAADPALLLLDEPAAGLRYLEKQALGGRCCASSRARA
ncbi:MAG: ATP-binding cassette domain-containing protein [Rhodopseudomonas palustris]|nr:ATP-binding cassette domain-containing protein [Rhodopseudomonas palustris]